MQLLCMRGFRNDRIRIAEVLNAEGNVAEKLAGERRRSPRVAVASPVLSRCHARSSNIENDVPMDDRKMPEEERTACIQQKWPGRIGLEDSADDTRLIYF